MGRKPNQLVLEFFHRGKKLEDASNRYEHTCKRCGELFPKGRIDGLLSHLLRRCPNVTQVDRENIFFFLQTNPSKPSNNSGKKSRKAFEDAPLQVPELSASAPSHQVPSMERRDQFLPPDFASNPLQQPSALETLAEVSRQRLDLSSQRDDQQIHSQDQSQLDDGRALAEQALLLHLQHAGGNALPTSHGAMPYSDPFTNATAALPTELRPGFPSVSSAEHAPVAERRYVTSGGNDTTGCVPQLQQHRTLDPELGAIPSAPPDEVVEHFPDNSAQHSGNDFMMWNPTNSTGRQTFGPFAAPSNQSGVGFGLLHNNTKRAARGRFTDTRRKEVQQIRKRGACLRCRMLKKPCSEGTPCNTCANVESARLWKGKCIRTRLAEEFTLWSAGLFHTKAKFEVPAAVEGLRPGALQGRMEARFFRSSDSSLSFAVKRYTSRESNEGSVAATPAVTGDANSRTIWLLDEGETMCDKIEEYSNDVATACIQEEASKFLRITLDVAQQLIAKEQTEQLNVVGKQNSARSCYNLHMQLLKNAVELWVETRILTTSDNAQLDLQYDQFKDAQHQPDPVTWSPEGSVPTTSPSHSYIRSQLLAAAETRCSRLAKTVINELERRLLQRQQISRFSTFITAVILLNCVERMACLYSRLDTQSASAVSYGCQSLLDEPARILWRQGEHFASLLTMLLRMRALPPKTQETSDGMLSAVRHPAVIPPSNERSQKASEDDDEQAATWLDTLKLQAAELRARRDSQSAYSNNAAAWDMKFISQILLPETA